MSFICEVLGITLGIYIGRKLFDDVVIPLWDGYFKRSDE